MPILEILNIVSITTSCVAKHNALCRLIAEIVGVDFLPLSVLAHHIYRKDDRFQLDVCLCDHFLSIHSKNSLHNLLFKGHVWIVNNLFDSQFLSQVYNLEQLF